jgi:ABC-type phosphate transport system substrate-binding protein
LETARHFEARTSRRQTEGELMSMTREFLCFVLAGTMSLAIGCGGGTSDSADGGGAEIVRVSRQNNSGTYVYFREAVLGENREFKLGSIDQSGSKDVVELVSRTPSAIGYSGMGYATPEVKMLPVSKDGGEPVAPTSENAMSGAYPLARPLHLYVLGQPEGARQHFIEWILSAEGQAVVEKIGYVPISTGGGTVTAAAPTEQSVIRMDGSDTMVNLAQAWAQDYMAIFSNVSVQVNGGGSGVGISKLINGTTDIANASRDIKPKEREEASLNAGGKEVIEYTVALDALAIYVHKENPVDSIDLKDLAEIYGDGGTITNWAKVPGYVK